MMQLKKHWKSISIVAIVMVYAVFGFFFAPGILKRIIVEKSRDLIGKPAMIDEIRLNPFALSVEIIGANFKNRNNVELLRFDDLYVNFQLSSLPRWAFTFDEIRLVKPRLNIEISDRGRLNLLDLGNAPRTARPVEPSGASPSKPGDALLPVIISELSLQEGQVIFTDRKRAKPFKEDLYPINLRLTDIKTRNGAKSPYHLTAAFKHDELIKWEGDISISPLASHGKINLSNISLRRVWAYFQERLNFDLQQIHLDIDTAYSLALAKEGPALLLDNGRIKINDLKIGEKDKDEPVVDIPSATISGLNFNLSDLNLSIGEISTQKGNIRCWKEKSGQMNFQSLFAIHNPDDTHTPNEVTHSTAEKKGGRVS